MRTTSIIRSALVNASNAAPKWLQRFLLKWLSFLSRCVGPRLGVRLYSLSNSVRWKLDATRVKQVSVGRHNILLHPHPGEFDFQAEFYKAIPYEKEVFSWLDNHLQNYDAVIEIGANVGVFSCYFERAAQLETGKLKRVYCFEPSRKAFGRLLENLRANDYTIAKPFNCAVGDTTQWNKFFEPTDHLTNGSLVKSFSEQFDSRVGETLVLSVGPELIDTLVSPDEKVLLKIDVEGYEPVLVKALREFLRTRKPDLIIEVLPITETEIEAALEGLTFKRFHIEHGGLIESTKFASSSDARDWLLRFE